MTLATAQHDTPAALAGNGYNAMSWGECMKGVIPNASFVVIDPDQEIHIGSLVSVVFKLEGAFNEFAQGLGTQDLLGVFKVFLGVVEDKAGPIYVFAQLNPPIIAPVRGRSIEALHLITGIIPSEQSTEHGQDRADSALELLRPFFHRCDPVAPINPSWRPPEEE